MRKEDTDDRDILFQIDESEPWPENRMDEREDSSNKKDERNSTSFIGEAISWVLTIVVAVAIAFLLNKFVLINAEIPSGSMENTIMTGDKLIGFRWSYLFSKPKRGDIIIFKYPDDESQNYVKRVIGCPGDTVVIESGKIYINGASEPLEENYLKEDWVVATGPYTFEVPEDSYFVMGDNRNDSWDARYWTNTYVAKDKILGKAIFRYWPINDVKVLH